MAESDVKFFRIVTICGLDIEPGDKNDSIADPKHAVRAECNGNECVSGAQEFPHSCNQLAEPAVRKS